MPPTEDQKMVWELTRTVEQAKDLTMASISQKNPRDAQVMLTASVLKLNNEVSREASRTQLLHYGFERIEALSDRNSEEVSGQEKHLRSIIHHYESEIVRMRALINGLFSVLSDPNPTADMPTRVRSASALPPLASSTPSN
jgi:hypothetical protein